MNSNPDIIRIATRGSALALAQSNAILEQCRRAFPDRAFELLVLKTTGDKLQALSPDQPDSSLGKGLFTKELEVALLDGHAGLAVHSLKDLPTELPPGLKLGAVSRRADVRDVLVHRGPKAAHPGFATQSGLEDLPKGATIATSSTRRQAQASHARPDLRFVPIRGNVGTRLRKLADQPEIDALILAAAGLERLGFRIEANGALTGRDPEKPCPPHLLAVVLSIDEMLPCVGQGALGIEIRENDPALETICAALDDPDTHACCLAERAFLHAMGGGCQSPVGACAQLRGDTLHLRAISFRDTQVRQAEAPGPRSDAARLGKKLARELSAAI